MTAVGRRIVEDQGRRAGAAPWSARAGCELDCAQGVEAEVLEVASGSTGSGEARPSTAATWRAPDRARPFPLCFGSRPAVRVKAGRPVGRVGAGTNQPRRIGGSSPSAPGHRSAGVSSGRVTRQGWSIVSAWSNSSRPCSSVSGNDAKAGYPRQILLCSPPVMPLAVSQSPQASECAARPSLRRWWASESRNALAAA